MKIGITYDLRDDYLEEGFGEEETAEFDRESTIAAIAEALRAHGHFPDRIGHIRALVGRLAAGERWEMVFNIAEGMYGYGRESQVPAILDAYNIPYTFSDPLTMAVSLHKAMAKRVLRDQGVPTADFVVVGEEEELAGIRLPYPLFVKPVAEGTGKGITAGSKVGSGPVLEAACRRIWSRFRQPALVECFLPGREFTVGILGNGGRAESLGCLEVLLRPGAEVEVYSYGNKERSEELVEYRVAGDVTARRAETVALDAWRGLGCRDAGRVDLRCDAQGRPHFIEVNPLAGLHPEHSDLPILCTRVGISYAELIGRILESALERSGKVNA